MARVCLVNCSEEDDIKLVKCLILNDMTGNLDAKKACSGAMKLHRKYLKKVLFLPWINPDDAFEMFN
ncbi:hypothetical protein POTOM_040009 [Populus tomentosa]|uniref:Uncharacterized protein n=1 Tax=Populus tomentosa TaxID=118781 RepID=A0A8X7YNH8_POPTO|nr:hypothetical protein POTOM_040009 [Populus tomentosa]